MALVSRSSETAKRPRYVPIICSKCSSSSLCSSKADTEAPSPIPLHASTVPISSRGCNGQSSLIVSKSALGEARAGGGRTERFPICKNLCQCTDVEAVRARFKFGMPLLYYGGFGGPTGASLKRISTCLASTGYGYVAAWIRVLSKGVKRLVLVHRVAIVEHPWAGKLYSLRRRLDNPSRSMSRSMNGSKPRVRTTVAFESNRPVPGLLSSA